MAQQDLSYVFQPVIHEPLSRPDVSSLSPTDCTPSSETNTEQKDVKDLFVDYSYIGYVGKTDSDGNSSPISPNILQDEKEALASIEEADKCRINHPRKAMSLYLKAGKALVLCSQADNALRCFRSLILLATQQLNRVLNEKKKLAKLRRSESEIESERKERNRVARTKSCDLPKKKQSTEVLSPEMIRRNCRSVSECTNDVEGNELMAVEEVTQQYECEFVAVEEIHNVEEDVDTAGIVMHCVEKVSLPEQITLCEPVVEMNVQEDLPVFSVSEVRDITSTEEMTMACESSDNVCVVNCFETVAPLDFEVATVESMDDSASTHSSTSNEDIVQTLNTEIVMMECNEVMMSAEEVPANPQQNAFIRRGYVVSELIDTEENYIRDLGHVIKGYMVALSKEFNVPNELKGKEKAIFSNIQSIHEWHSTDFVKDLKECEDNPSNLGEVFSSAELKLEELYTFYCRSKSKSDELVLPHKEAFFKECRKRLGHRLQLSDYLIKPVQRITKYQLLLRDILKFTEKAGEDGSEIQRAIDVALRILKRTNDMISAAMIQGYDAKPEDTGDLLLRETLGVAEGKYRQKMKERSVFLFEKLIIITEPFEKEGGVTELRFQNTIKTRGLGQTESVDSDPCRWAVWLRKRSTAEIYVFRAPTTQVKEKWIKNIKECNNLKKKSQGLLKSLYRSKTFRREESDAKEILDALTPNLLTVEDEPVKPKGERKSKRNASKVMSRKKKNAGISDRLKGNIMRFRAEEQMLSVEEPDEELFAEPPNSLRFSPESDLPQSPDPYDTLEQESCFEIQANFEAEENQLKKVLLLTRLIAARLLQTKDAAEALDLYVDVIGSVLPIEGLRKCEEITKSRDVLLQQCTGIYDAWRKESLFTSKDVEELYTSMTSLLSETAGFCSLHKGNSWSVVLYSVGAMACSREQKWRDASQAFYRLSLVYSALQSTSCAVDSLVDAHWMCCHSGDYQGAVNLFYNAFIRALACRDLIRCLRFEQQGLFLVERLTSKDNNNNCDSEDENESRGLVSSQHLAFLITLSRSTRRKDWAWFEFAETELNIIVNLNSGRQAGAILSSVFKKIKQTIGESSVESYA